MEEGKGEKVTASSAWEGFPSLMSWRAIASKFLISLGSEAAPTSRGGADGGAEASASASIMSASPPLMALQFSFSISPFVILQWFLCLCKRILNWYQTRCFQQILLSIQFDSPHFNTFPKLGLLDPSRYWAGLDFSIIVNENMNIYINESKINHLI